MSSKTNKAKPKPKRNRRQRRQRASNPDIIPRLRIVRMNDIVPPRLVTHLKYIVARNLGNNGGQVASIQLNANGIYDVDPSLGSTSTPGFTEFMAFFQRYRVLKVKSLCTFINNEGFPMVINLGFEPVFYAANAKTQAYFEGSCQKTQLVPRTQVARGITLVMSKESIAVTGDPMSRMDLNYTGTAASNPASLFYTSISCSSQNTGLNMSQGGCTIRWEVYFEVEFFERKVLQN